MTKQQLQSRSHNSLCSLAQRKTHSEQLRRCLLATDFPIHTLQQGMYRSSYNHTAPEYGTRRSPIRSVFSQVSLHLHNYNSKKLEETRMCTQLQSTVLSIWIVPQLAALISSLDFDKTSGCTERESNIVLLCNEKRKLDSFAVAY